MRRYLMNSVRRRMLNVFGRGARNDPRYWDLHGQVSRERFMDILRNNNFDTHAQRSMRYRRSRINRFVRQGY